MSNFFISNGYPSSSTGSGTAPTNPDVPRYPFTENLRLSRFNQIYKLSPVDSSSDLTPGDMVALQDCRGAFLQMNGEKILYVLSSGTTVDGAEQLKAVPYQEFETFSKPLVPPYLQVGVDKEKLHTVKTTMTKIPDGDDFKYRVDTMELTLLDTMQIEPTGAQFVLNANGNTLVAPYTVLKIDNTAVGDLVSDQPVLTYNLTLMVSNQDLWTLIVNAEEGNLYFQFPPCKAPDGTYQPAS